MSRKISLILRKFPILLRLPYLLFSRVQSRYTVGVAAVVIDPLGRVLLVEHAYHPRFPWGLPGGWIDDDEDPQAAILRELEEELQLDARVMRVIHASKTVPNHIDLAFQCEVNSPVGQLSHELLDYKWVSPTDLPDIKSFHRKSIELASTDLQAREQWERH